MILAIAIVYVPIGERRAGGVLEPGRSVRGGSAGTSARTRDGWCCETKGCWSAPQNLIDDDLRVNSRSCQSVHRGHRGGKTYARY